MEEHIMRAALVRGMRVESFQVRVSERNHQIVRKKLEQQRKKIIDRLKQLKEEGIIKSIYIPKNKKIQDKLDKLTRAKKSIKQSIDMIIEIFCK